MKTKQLQSISTFVGTNKKFNFDLETLRGIAAIAVVWGHATVTHGWIDPNYSPTGIWSYTAPGHLCVLVFFLLSGYVIGFAHPTPLDYGTTPSYIKKRIVRIYPIYVICLLFAIISANSHFSALTILSHLTLTQGIFSPVIKEISPAWSLTYEVAFYILFIPLSHFRISPAIVMIFCIVTGYFSIHYADGWPLFSSFAFGFTFWLCGLFIAQKTKNLPEKPDYSLMLGCICLLMSIGKLDAPVTLFYQVSTRVLGSSLSITPSNQPGFVGFRDFGYLAYCVAFLLAFTKTKVPYLKLFYVLLLAAPAATYYYYFIHANENTASTLVIPTLFYAAACYLIIFSNYAASISQRFIKAMIATGTISYGLYIVHYPILAIFRQIPLPSGNALTFSFRLLCFIFVSVVAAYLLEKRFQLWIRRLVFKR